MFITASTSARFKVPILSQINPVHISLSHTLKMRSQNFETPLFIFGMCGCPHEKKKKNSAPSRRLFMKFDI
jgi:hypothetical protein